MAPARVANGGVTSTERPRQATFSASIREGPTHRDMHIRPTTTKGRAIGTSRRCLQPKIRGGGATTELTMTTAGGLVDARGARGTNTGGTDSMNAALTATTSSKVTGTDRISDGLASPRRSRRSRSGARHPVRAGDNARSRDSRGEEFGYLRFETNSARLPPNVTAQGDGPRCWLGRTERLRVDPGFGDPHRCTATSTTCCTTGMRSAASGSTPSVAADSRGRPLRRQANRRTDQPRQFRIAVDSARATRVTSMCASVSIANGATRLADLIALTAHVVAVPIVKALALAPVTSSADCVAATP